MAAGVCRKMGPQLWEDCVWATGVQEVLIVFLFCFLIFRLYLHEHTTLHITLPFALVKPTERAWPV